MPYRLKIDLLVPDSIVQDHPFVNGKVVHQCAGMKDDKKACPIAAGLWHGSMYVAAGWDEQNKRQLGWVVREAAEKYGREKITPLGHDWEIIEHDW